MLYKSLKRILRYIKYVGTESYLQGYVDADWAGCIEDRKFTSGYVFKIFGCVITWCSKKQSCVSLCSTDAEYISLSIAVSEECWLSNIVCDLCVTNHQVIMFEDNQSVIKLVYNNENNTNTN
ncbi:hypothetical protein PR048_015553 [Dryococelus australis]|uniref:Mitochondrial protein n=1 Tax=Dryococelus australis TaxID=614101 RepID=A0ABQ9HHC1_9NEOP|nr:hypothetical protein PR048_015553 [Dryococelus australis]